MCCANGFGSLAQLFRDTPLSFECKTDPTRSNGHGCMLQYALLHLFGYGVSMDDLKNFRVSISANSFQP